MKRLISLALAMLVLTTAAAAKEPLITEYKGADSEQLLWDDLSQHSPSDEVTAGILAYFWRESQYRSDSVSGWATLELDGFDLCEYVVSATDEGLEDGSSKEWFIETVRSCGGYGLGQWYALRYLGPLYDFAQERGTSIGDAEMQCEFVLQSMQANTELWEALLSCDDPGEAGWLIAVLYDGTQDGAGYMRWKAHEIFGRMEDG